MIAKRNLERDSDSDWCCGVGFGEDIKLFIMVDVTEFSSRNFDVFDTNVSSFPM